MTEKLTRREFVKTGAIGAAAAMAATYIPSRAFGANERIGFGMIGVGGRGSGVMSEMYQAGIDQNVEIVAVCDIWKQRREAAAEKVKGWHDRESVPAFVDYKDLLAQKNVDIVGIVTPDFSHCHIMKDALKTGKDVFVEKPMASNMKEANEVLDLAKKHSRVVQVGTQRRSDARHQTLARVIQSGILGKITLIECAWDDNGPRWRRGKINLTEQDVDWKLYLVGKKARPFEPRMIYEWHLFREMCNGPISLLGVHLIDLVSWVMNDPYPVSAVSNGGTYVWKDGREHEDTITTLYDFPSGFMCAYTSAFGNGDGPWMKIRGTKGTFDYNTWTITGAGGGAEKIKEPIVVNVDNDLIRESHSTNFLRCVRSRQTPTAGIEAGHQHSVAGIMGYEAMIQGKRIKYDANHRKIYAG